MDPDSLASAETITLLRRFLGCRKHKSSFWTLRGTEFVRQYQFLKVIFLDTSAAQNNDSVISDLTLEVHNVKTHVQEGSIADIGSRTERLWTERKTWLEQRALAASDTPLDALLVYLCRRQLGWFIDSGIDSNMFQNPVGGVVRNLGTCSPFNSQQAWFPCDRSQGRDRAAF
jgi:hypothetical protein